MEIERVQQVAIFAFFICNTFKEKSLLEIELRTIKERYEDGLDEALNEALKKYRDQEEYWSDRVQVIEKSRQDVKNNFDKLVMDFDQLKFRAQIDKTELEQRLASSIEHIAILNQQV
jgi:hypothetical protein